MVVKKIVMKEGRGRVAQYIDNVNRAEVYWDEALQKQVAELSIGYGKSENYTEVIEVDNQTYLMNDSGTTIERLSNVVVQGMPAVARKVRG